MRPAVNPNVVAILRTYYTTNIDPGEIEEAVEIAGYHDAQRLQGPGSSGYGPLVKIYTGPERRTDSEFQAVGGAVVAVAEVYGDATSGGSGTPAYVQLKLDNNDASTRLYCVFLWLHAGTSEGSTSNDWEAFVRPVTPGGACVNGNPRAPYELDVRRDVLTGTTPDDYPAAVRFDDDNTGMPTIGVNCGRGWCEMRRALAANRLPKTPARRTGNIKPWHDEQFVAEPLVAPGFGVRRSSAEMSITPVEGLATIPASDFTSAAGAKVATVRAVSVPPGDKYATWRLKAGSSGRDLYLKNDNGAWSARFVDEGTMNDPSDWLYVNRTRHRIATVPGVARWLWNEYDEDIWVSCEQGCCEVSGALFSESAAPVEAEIRSRRRWSRER
jgi:hypothetical protein